MSRLTDSELQLEQLVDEINSITGKDYKLVDDPTQTTLTTTKCRMKIVDENYKSIHRRGTEFTAKEMKAFLKGMIKALKL